MAINLVSLSCPQLERVCGEVCCCCHHYDAFCSGEDTTLHYVNKGWIPSLSRCSRAHPSMRWRAPGRAWKCGQIRIHGWALGLSLVSDTLKNNLRIVQWVWSRKIVALTVLYHAYAITREKHWNKHPVCDYRNIYIFMRKLHIFHLLDVKYLFVYQITTTWTEKKLDNKERSIEFCGWIVVDISLVMHEIATIASISPSLR